jgi:hypothetical protein
MAIIKNCSGCGKEMDMKLERVHPQTHNEFYCDPCNKKYNDWVKIRQPIYEKHDLMRDQDLLEKKNAHFGNKAPAVVTEDEKKTILAAVQDQTALNEAKLKAGDGK